MARSSFIPPPSASRRSCDLPLDPFRDLLVCRLRVPQDAVRTAHPKLLVAGVEDRSDMRHGRLNVVLAEPAQQQLTTPGFAWRGRLLHAGHADSSAGRLSISATSFSIRRAIAALL